jgi:hypothetical protein
MHFGRGATFWQGRCAARPAVLLRQFELSILEAVTWAKQQPLPTMA